MNISKYDIFNGVIKGTEENDKIITNAARSTIDALGGNDTIMASKVGNGGYNNLIKGGAGNDNILNDAASVTIDGGADNDYIQTDGVSENSSINGGDGNDTIRNYCDHVTISGGRGDDSLVNAAKGNNIYFKYAVGDGNDYIKGFKNYSRLSISGGVYDLKNSGSNIAVSVGDGRDNYASIYSGSDVIVSLVGNGTITLEGAANRGYIYKVWLYENNKQSNVAIFGSGAALGDTVINSGDKASIFAYYGKDTISNAGNFVTIDGGMSDDTIDLASGASNNLIVYKVGDGNDLIKGFNATSTLSINGGEVAYVSSEKRGSDIVVTVGNEKITLQGAANLSKANIVETSFNINNNVNNRNIIASGLSDTITNTGDRVTIQAMRGNDSINNKAANVYIDGGDGNDRIVNTGKNVTITAQAGNDTISNENTNVLISGGAGNDSVVSKGTNVTINGGDGADTIENNSDTVSIAGGSGDDFIKNLGNKVTIDGGAGHDTISSKSTSTSISTADGNDLISLQASYKNTVNGGKGSDTIKLDANSNEIFIQYNLGDGDDVIEGFNSTSTLRIGNGDNTYSKSISGNDVIVTAEDGGKITLKGAATLANVNINGVTNINTINTANDVAIAGMRLADNIANRGTNVTISTFAGKDTVHNYGRFVTIDTGADVDYISSNNANNSSINAGAGDDDIINVGGYQNTILGGKGNDNIYISSSEQALIIYNSGDGNDYITDFNSTSTLQIGNGTGSYYKEIKDDDVIITVDKDKITLKGAATLPVVNIAGEEEITGKNVRNKDDYTIVSGTGGDDTVRNTGANVELNALGGNDSIRNSGDNVTINGGVKNDSISNEGYDVTIVGGLDNDQIYNDEGENILFAYNAGDGNDVITGFNETSTLSISGGLYSLRTSGNDVIVSVNDGKITLKGAASLSTVNIIGVKDKPASYINNSTNEVSLGGGNADDTIDNTGWKATIFGYDGNDSIRSRYRRVTIDGGAGNDRIINSGNNAVYASLNGGDGNDYIRNHLGNSATLVGGDGDDTLSDYSYYSRIIGGKGDDYIYLQDRDQREWIFYNTGDGNDYIAHFNTTARLLIDGGSGEYSTQKSGNNIIVTIGDGKITLEGAASLSRLNIHGVEKKTAILINNTVSGSSVAGTEGNDTITNAGESVTINAVDGNDLITNNGSGNESSINAGAGDDTIVNNHAQEVEIVAAEDNDSIHNSGNDVTIDGGAGNDTITNDRGFYASISGAEGDDLISVTKSTDSTINGGAGNDTIKLDSEENFIEYKSGDGNDLIQGFNENSTLSISGGSYSTKTSGNDVIVTVGKDKITLEGAANLSANIVGEKKSAEPQAIASANFTVANSKVAYESNFSSANIGNAYKFNQAKSSLNISNALEDTSIKITNAEDSAIRASGTFGSAILNSGNVLEYQLNTVALTSKNFNDKISFGKDTTLTYGDIQVELLKGSVISTNGAKEISFDNNSSANITAPEGSKININAGTFTINNLPVNSSSGKGTISVENDGLSFEGYGVQFVDLEVAKEGYFEQRTSMTVEYKFSDKSYVIHNMAVIKTLANDFTKLTFDISAAEDYAHYEVNGKEFVVSSVADNINVVGANGDKFKVQGKELDAAKIGRITLDERITFSGTEIDYDGVKVNYAHNKPVSYSLDGKEISISDAATVTTSGDTKTFKCEAGSYVINGRSFETSADLTFTADANQIKIPLTDAKTEIYFDGVKVSGLSDGGEVVFDLSGGKIFIPSGAEINVTSPEEVKLNLAAGTFTIDDKKISSDTALEIAVDKNDLKIPLSENPVTINGANITGNGEMTIDNTDAIFFTILLPDGALVKNVSNNTFELNGKNNSASFGDTNKKVLLTEDGAAYVEFDKENSIGVGFNGLMFEHVEILGNDAWTVETSGTSGIDKITGITDGATISTSTAEIDAGDLRFEVETDGAGEFTICGEKFNSTGKNTYVVRGNSNGEIKAVPLADEFKGDDSEAAGKIYQFDSAGDYTVNGITFHAEKNSKAQTITHGVELDLSTGKFQYDGLTLEGSGTAKIDRYNAKLVSLTDGAKVSGSDESKYNNRQFEINGAVELVGKKFETNQPIRCGLLNIQDTWEISINGNSIEIPFALSGFVAGDKYVVIKADCYESVKLVDGKISSIAGVKNSAEITGNGLSNVSILTTESGKFSVRGKKFNISDDLDGVTFVTDSHGNVSEINGLTGSVTGNFENEISVNGKVIRLTGASAITVTSDGENITEISNVAGDLGENSYRKDVRVYKLGGAEKLTTSADGTIIFSGNKFQSSAGKTFMLDDSGNVSGLEKAQTENVFSAADIEESDDNANSTENFATINLSTTDGLEEIFGDFSEGLTVNGVFVKVTDSTNFVVKNDDENVYIETTAADTFTINGKTFETSADKTIFKLDADGNVCEVVTDEFYLYPDSDSYRIAGDFSDEIIFNGKKFCVTGTNDASIFIGDETLIYVELARNSVEVIESGGASEIALSGAGDVTIGGKTFSTSDEFTGSLQIDSAGDVYSAEYFVGTLSGELGGLEFGGISIDSYDNFSVTGDGEKITAIENLQNGTLTGGDLDSVTINGAVVTFDDSGTITIIDGKLKGATEPVDSGDDAEEIADMFTGDADKIVAAKGRATIKNYDHTTGEAFTTEYENIADAVKENLIAFDDGKLTVNSTKIIFDDDADSRIINFIDANGNVQKVGFANENASLDASEERGGLILVGEENSTLISGAGNDTIFADEGSYVDAGGGKNLVELNGGDTIVELSGNTTVTGFNDSDALKTSVKNLNLQYDGKNITAKNNSSKVTLEDVSNKISIVDGEETLTAYVAQDGENISVDEPADIYFGNNSGVDFSNCDENILLNLSENFHGINKITAGNGRNTIIGSKANETLIAGKYNNSIYGGGGLNLLQGYSGDDKIGHATFFALGQNDGAVSIIEKFEFVEPGNYINAADVTADAIDTDIANNRFSNVAITEDGGILLEVTNNGTGAVEKLLVTDAMTDAGYSKDFVVNGIVAQVGQDVVNVDKFVNFYLANGLNATAQVDSSVTGELSIWLSDSLEDRGKQFEGDFKVIDARNSNAVKSELAGNDSDNTILAGNSGATSLWGGNGGNDLLVGGEGIDSFYYGLGNGNDTITGVNEGDAIILANITLDQISDRNITDNAVVLNFIDGGSLRVEGNSDVTYQLADGSKFSANHETMNWNSK